MSSLSKTLVCHWRASPLLSAAYSALWLMALLAVGLSAISLGAKLAAWMICGMHAYWSVPRKIWLTHPSAITGIKCENNHWFVYSHAKAWQSVELGKNSIALPWLILLSVKVKGQLLPQGICLVTDALARDSHRRLRVRLKFSRQRWLALK